MKEMKSIRVIGGKVRMDRKDQVAMDVPLLIRSLEWSREDAKNDMQLHRFAEKALTAQRKAKPLTMRQYNKLVK